MGLHAGVPGVPIEVGGEWRRGARLERGRPHADGEGEHEPDPEQAGAEPAPAQEGER